MRSRWLILALSLVFVGLTAPAGRTADIKLMGLYGTSNQSELDELSRDLFDKDFFDHIAGGEIQVRSFAGGQLGVALAAGALFWQPSEFKIVEGIEGFSTAGKLTSFPVGASALLKVGHSPVRFVAEGGLRYVYNKSSIDWSYAVLGTPIDLPIEFKVGDMLAGVIGADLEVGLDEALHVCVGGGYMFPIKKADVSVSGSGALGDLLGGDINLGDIELEAYFIRGGVVLSF